MIVDDEMTVIQFEKLRPGDVYMCPQSRGWFMKISGAVEHSTALVGLNCVRLSDGKLMSSAEDARPVDFYRGARLVVPG